MVLLSGPVFRAALLSIILAYPGCAQENLAKDMEDMDGVYPESHIWDDSHLHRFHAEVDANSDSKVSYSEIVDVVEEHHRDVAHAKAAHLMDARDDSNDGLVNLEEHLHSTVGLDGDGEQFEAQEVEQQTALFHAADENKDGFLNQTELGMLEYPAPNTAIMDININRSIQQTDLDGDGKLDVEEFKKNYFMGGEDGIILTDDKVFSQVDKNADGFVDHKELQTLLSGQLDRQVMVKDMITNLDQDGDKHIDVKELIDKKDIVSDSALQDYLVAWAKRRKIPQVV